MKKLKYYLGLEYPLEIRRLKKEDGSGYLASIPQLGSKAFSGHGDTIHEALGSLAAVKEHLFRDYLKEGVPIPEPEPELESIFSGKFVVRIPAALHRELVGTAQKQNVSLNQLVVHLLSYHTPLRALERKLEECFREIQSKLSKIEFAFSYAQPIGIWTGEKDRYPQAA